ncbi:MAG: type II toxin-antitoxin system RelE/ParE family toxin [Acidobacteria bacterium]|nr:type II toxin-antitoxin system RelE/ParE family toxin [Acidobacteriota bacterium]
MKPYRFLREADDEFHEHIAYFDGYSLSSGDRFIAEVADAVSDIRRYPESGSRISRRVRKRVLHTYKYSVLYVDTPSEIVIVAVASHRRKPGYWKRRLGRLGR